MTGIPYESKFHMIQSDFHLISLPIFAYYLCNFYNSLEMVTADSQSNSNFLYIGALLSNI